MIRRLPLLALVVVVGAAAAACSEDKKLDAGLLEEQIEAGIVDAYGVTPRSVVCPEDVKVDPGATLICTADIDGQDFKVEVTQGEEGQPNSFTNPQALIPIEEAEPLAELLALNELGFGVTADCGDEVIIGRPGSTFNCTLTEESGATVEATFRITDESGDFEFAE